MDSPLDRRFICKRQPATVREFVEFWASRYHDKKERLYTTNICGPHTREGLDELFRWKIVPFYWNRMRPSLDRNFLSKLDVARDLSDDISAREFLDVFSEGGPIHRIFWLHCWHPDRFPIYDQHVHRAMTYLQDGKLEELSTIAERKVIASYIDQYLPFHAPFAKLDLPFDPTLDGVRSRKADRALVTFGSSIKDLNDQGLL
jgi:hypothetical protein